MNDDKKIVKILINNALIQVFFMLLSITAFSGCYDIKYISNRIIFSIVLPIVYICIKLIIFVAYCCLALPINKWIYNLFVFVLCSVYSTKLVQILLFDTLKISTLGVIIWFIIDFLFIYRANFNINNQDK